MGASAWDYYVPHQADFGTALEELRHRVFLAGDYYWVHGGDWLPEEERRPLPSPLDELWDDEWTKHCGTHSILDVFHVQRENEVPEICAVQRVSAEEAQRFVNSIHRIGTRCRGGRVMSQFTQVLKSSSAVTYPVTRKRAIPSSQAPAL